ncbi:MAG: (d)CMP kinase, partial [Nakamurella sp.]
MTDGYDVFPGRRLVAIDGPSGTGKSTVARAVARTLGSGYLDTGALYRTVTLHVLQAGIDPGDDEAVAASLAGMEFDAPTDPDRQQHRLGGVDVTSRIRAEDVTSAVSAVAANPAVRAFLLQQQREIAYGAPMVVEGRDIGTVIAPDAPVKIYLTADAAVRAARRLRQNADGHVAGPGNSAGVADTVEAVEADLER